MSRVLVVLALLSGCSFGLSGPAANRPRNKVPECDTGKGTVVLDGVAATLFGVAALATLGTDVPAVALLPGAIAAIYVGAAIAGNNRVNACREAMDEFQTAYAEPPVLPRERHAASGPPGADQPPPPPQPSVAAAEPAPEAAASEPSAPAPPAAKAPPPPAAKAAPSPAAKPVRAVGAKPAPKPEEPEWSEFWREVTP